MGLSKEHCHYQDHQNMRFFAIINLTFLFGLSNCLYDPYRQSPPQPAPPKPLAPQNPWHSVYKQTGPKLRRPIIGGRPRSLPGGRKRNGIRSMNSRLQAARRIYFRPKGSFKLGPIPGFNNNGANSKAKEGKQALALAKPMTADAVSIGFGLAEANANRLPGKFTNPGFQSTNFLNLNTVTPAKNKDDVHSRAKKYGAYHLCRGSSSMACDSQGRRVQLYARRTLVTPSVRKVFRSASPRRWKFPQELNRVTTPKPQALYLDPVMWPKAVYDTVTGVQKEVAGKFQTPRFLQTNFLNNDPNWQGPKEAPKGIHAAAKQYGAYHLCPGSTSIACDSTGKRVQLYARRTLVTPSGRKGFRSKNYLAHKLGAQEVLQQPYQPYQQRQATTTNLNTVKQSKQPSLLESVVNTAVSLNTGIEPFHAGREKIQTVGYQNRHGPIAGKFGGSFAQTNFNTNDPNVQNPIQTGYIPANSRYQLCPGSTSTACNSQGQQVQLWARRSLVIPSGRKGFRRNAFRQQTLPTPQKLFLDPVAFGKAGVDTAIQAQNAQAGKFSSPGFTATNFATNDPNNNKPVQTGYTPASTRPLNRGTVTGSNSWFNWRGTGKGNRPLSWSTLTNFRRSFVTPRRRAFRTIRSGYF